MPLPFDATLKNLVERYTPDFATALNLQADDDAEVLNVDLSTISAASDSVLGFGTPPRLLADLNFQSGPDADVKSRILLYNALLHHRYHVPVHSVLILLRPAADRSDLDGKVEYRAQPRRGRMRFSFEVIRLWERPVARLLRLGLGILPLAILGKTSNATELRSVARRIAERLQREAPEDEARELLAATFVLSGLRVPPKSAIELFQGLAAMKDSTTYQMILEEGRQVGREQGRLDEARRLLLQLGQLRFGEPTSAEQTVLERLSDTTELERLSARLLDVQSWAELLRDE